MVAVGAEVGEGQEHAASPREGGDGEGLEEDLHGEVVGYGDVGWEVEGGGWDV